MIGQAQEFVQVLKMRRDKGQDVEVTFIENVGCCAKALGHMSSKDFLASYEKLVSIPNEEAKKSLAEKATRFGIGLAEGFIVGTVCSIGFMICIGGMIAGTISGTAALSGSDKLFGHEIGLRENLTDAALTAGASAICGTAFSKTCGKAFGFRLRPLGYALTPDTQKVALIWAGKFALDRFM